MKKPVILVHTDSPQVSTGFGRVCYNLVTRWLQTGKYRIVVLGMNDRGEYHPLRQAHPDLIIEPLPYLSEDPYGVQRLPEILRKYEPDIVFALNDIWVWSGDQRHPQLLNWYKNTLNGYKPYLPWVGYFAVDGRPWEKLWVDLVNNMTYAVVFSDYGEKVLKETDDINLSKLRKIYHGHDTQNFYPVPKEDSNKVRADMGIKPDDFLIGCINRNQPRKNIPALIQAFKMFRDGYVKCKECGHPRNLEVMIDCEICGSTEYSDKFDGVGPKAFLYLHMNPLDGRGYRLPKVQSDNKASGIITRSNFDVANGVPINELNLIYNACDVIVNPTTAGGYELTVAEAMAAGVPVVATRTTSIVEQLENDRGYLVKPSAYMVLDDANHCLKHIISLQGLIDALFDVYSNPDEARRRAENAIPFAKSRNWDNSAKLFDDLFESILKDRINLADLLDREKRNVLIVNNSNNLGYNLSMIPSVKFVAKNNPSIEFKLAVNKNIKPLLNDLLKLDNVNIIENEKMWLDRASLDGFKINVNDITNIPEQNKNIVKIVGVESAPSIIELFSNAFRTNLSVDEFSRLLDIPYSISNDEIDFANNIFEDAKDKFKLVFLIKDSPNFSVPKETINKVISFLSKHSDTEIFLISKHNYINNINVTNKIDIESLSNRQIIALLSKCDCVITSDDEYAHVANFIDTPFIIISGANDYRNFVKHSRSLKINKNDHSSSKKNIVFISNKNKYQCMPCMKSESDKCASSDTNIAHCMGTISPGEIFARVSNMRDYWLSNK